MTNRAILVIAVCVVLGMAGAFSHGAAPTAGFPAAKAVDDPMDPQHPERGTVWDLGNPQDASQGTIWDNIAAMRKVDHIPGKPWALMGWSEANRLTGYEKQRMAFNYFPSKAACIKDRKWNIAHEDRGSEAWVAFTAAECTRVTP